MDANDGNGPSPDKGTGETYGDWMAALMTHDSCIGAGYLSSNCDGFGDACTSCTGVRDIDYAKHTSATPHTVGNFTQLRCPAGGGYNGPCLQEGHCESYVSSEALWDLATRDLPNPGTDSAWAIMDRPWYLSRPTATAAFTCFRTAPTWTSDGCGTGSLWKTMRAVDDDDGNLSNGTPHSAALYAAFNRHSIACTSDTGASTSFRGCSQQPAIPTLSLAASNNQVTVSWSGSTGVYDIYRNEQGCNAGGFVKVANDRTTSPFTDSDVANDFVYYYRVVAQPSGNEACASAPSSCKEAIPCSPPVPPGLFGGATQSYKIYLQWAESPGASRYHVYRATAPGGPYARIATLSNFTFWDTGLNSCTTYFYVARAAKSDTCESGDSNQFSATAGTGGSLIVSKSGTGTGTVTSSPSGINCGADCCKLFSYGTWATLTATPGVGSMFNGWGGDLCWGGTGTGTCTVVMDSIRKVYADFRKYYTLTVSVNPSTATGTVTSSPTGINCGEDCSEQYIFNPRVALAPAPAVGFVFSGWSGDCTGTGGCAVDMTQDRSVSASFSVATYTLALGLVGTGSGTVTSTPAGISCGADCNEVYNYNASVTLTATPSTGSVFGGWSGACSGTGTCTVAMTQAKAVTATFLITTHVLTVSLAGTGSGTVASSPVGINCGVDCNEAYNYNTSVTLTPTPSTGSSVFIGWSGGCSGTFNCTVAMTQARNVTATFANATNLLTVTRAGTGSGTVKSTPIGIDCGSDCSEAYNYNTSVTLTATSSSALSNFEGWSGACTGTSSCVVDMNQERSVTATFSDKGRDFYTVAPCRVFDSRVTDTPLTSQVPLIINIVGTCGVPATAKAVSLNVTAISAPGDGFITLYPGDITLPDTWTVSFLASLNRANNALIPLAWNGNGTLAALAVITGGGSMNMTLDVNGYYE